MSIKMKNKKDLETIFKNKDKIIVRSHIIGQRLNIKAIKNYSILKNLPFAIEVGEGVVVLFRYGVVVLFGVDKNAEEKFMRDISPHVSNPYKDIETEDVTIIKDSKNPDKVSFEEIRIAKWDLDRILVVADVLAKSQVLSYHEDQMIKTFDNFEPLALTMQKKGGLGWKKTRQLISYIGATLGTQRNMMGQVEVLDKPDFLWDKPPALEGLYVRLEDEFELRERHNMLKEKLDLIYKTSDMMLDMVNTKRSLRVEWYITLLIVFEIVLHIIETYIMKTH